MTTHELRCERENCPGEFAVDDDDERARCPKCGSKHTPPWDNPDAEVIDGRDGQDPPVADGGDTSAGVTVGGDTDDVHIHIHIHRE
jgi:hypothetical protein